MKLIVGYILLLLNTLQFAYIIYLSRTINTMQGQIKEMSEQINNSVTDWEAFKHFYCQCMNEVPQDSPYRNNGLAKICK